MRECEIHYITHTPDSLHPFGPSWVSLTCWGQIFTLWHFTLIMRFLCQIWAGFGTVYVRISNYEFYTYLDYYPLSRDYLTYIIFSIATYIHTALKLSGIHLIYKFIVVKYCSRNILFQLYYFLMDLRPILICSVPNEAVYYTAGLVMSLSCSPGKPVRWMYLCPD